MSMARATGARSSRTSTILGHTSRASLRTEHVRTGGVGWEDERTQLEAREVGERVSGDGDGLKVLRVSVGSLSGSITLLERGEHILTYGMS